MSGKLTWQFQNNEADEIEGPNDPGITHFIGNREESLVREAIQNSLDARDNPALPVKVAFEPRTIPTADFGASELSLRLKAAADSTHNDDDEYIKQFTRGARLLNRTGNGSVDCLRIIDSNTLGATDEPRKNDAPSKWQALTKGAGSNAKDQRDAAGSFGLGKFAAFAVSDLRTVLYSVAYLSDGALARRFQGKTILVSHEQGGKPYRKTGYFGEDGFLPAKNVDIPRPFMLNEPGTALYIPGYTLQGERHIFAVIKHFFHAVVQSKLEVVVGSKLVKSSNIEEFANRQDGKTLNFIKVSRLEPYAKQDIPEIGEVTIRIQVHEDAPGKRELALVRDAGMMITDRRGDMNLSGLSHIPRHWKGFTAIIECLSKGEQSLLRDAESPRHNSISTDYITDPERQKAAAERLEVLGQWCRDRIAALVEPQLSDADNVGEVAKYLPLEDDGDQEQDANISQRGKYPVITTQPYQSVRAPSRPRLRGSGPKSRAVVLGNGKAEPEGNQDDIPRNPTPRPPGPVRPRTVANVPAAFGNLRFRPSGGDSTHSVVVFFNNPKQPLENVQLMAIGEDGAEVQIGLREAKMNGQDLPVNQDSIQRIDGGDASRISVEFVTREPIINKTFNLKGLAKK